MIIEKGYKQIYNLKYACTAELISKIICRNISKYSKTLLVATLTITYDYI